MFSRSDEFIPSHRWSITQELTFLYALVTASILICIAILLCWALGDMMTTAEKQYLVDEAYVIQDILKRNPTNYAAAAQEAYGVPPTVKNASYYYYIRLFNEKGQTILESPDFKRSTTGAQFPAISSDFWSTTFFNWKSATGKPFILMSAPVQFDNSGKAILFMQIAIDSSYPQLLLNKYRIIIFVILIISLVSVILLSILITRKALYSLHEMADITRQITATQLSKRINSREWPKELNSLGQAFNEMLNGIENAFTRLDQCTAELAHELRTPINNLMIGTEITLSQHRNVEDYRQSLESNLEEYRKLNNLVENILFLARAENPSTKINYAHLNIKNELAKLCEFYKILANEKNIQLTYQGEGILYADHILLHRALSNILTNAIRYTAHGSIIQVSAKTIDNYFIQISVKDNGIGITKGHLTKIFERFYRIETINTNGEINIGLGLAIVKSIMDLHKGDIKITSEPGVGTEINLLFPILSM